MAFSLIIVALIGVSVFVALVVLYRNISLLRRELKATAGPAKEARTNEEKPLEGSPIVSKQMVHDLNNIIGTIAGFTDAALEDLPKSSPIRTDLQEVLAASERAKLLVAQIKRSYGDNHEEKRVSAAPTARSLSNSPASRRVGGASLTSSYPPVAKPVPAYERKSSSVSAAPLSVSAAPRSSIPPQYFSDNMLNDRTLRDGDFGAASSRVRTYGSGGEHLLIVDDEIQLLTMFRRVFEPRGYQVTTFSNGLVAWDDFQKHSDMYDLAILDQRMPEMSGTSLAIEMLNCRPDFPIILLSGFSDTISPDDAARIGIRKFLSKPIPQAELAETIRKTLDEPRYV